MISFYTFSGGLSGGFVALSRQPRVSLPWRHDAIILAVVSSAARPSGGSSVISGSFIKRNAALAGAVLGPGVLSKNEQL